MSEPRKHLVGPDQRDDPGIVAYVMCQAETVPQAVRALIPTLSVCYQGLPFQAERKALKAVSQGQ